MDMLYARYSCPMDLVRVYIEQRRFGDFVKHFIQAENERRKIENDKDEEWKMWTAYVHSYSDKSFIKWREEILGGSEPAKKTGGADADLDDAGIQAIINKTFKG